MCSQIHRRQLALAGLLSSCLFAADTVTFVVGEWGPYTGQEMPGHGLATEIVSAACAAEGLSADVSFRPWKRAEVDVSKGASFATFPYQLIPERTDSFMFSDTICTSAMAILVAQGNPRTAALDVNRPEDLKGLQVGIVVGTDAVRFPLQKAGIAAEEVETPAQNLKKLELGRIDCIIDDRAVLLQTLAAACRARGR